MREIRQLGAVWGRLGPSWVPLGRFGGRLGALLAVLGTSWGPWGRLGAVLGAPGGGSGPPRALLGPSWGRLGASWAPPGGLLGASWGHFWGPKKRLGGLLGPIFGPPPFLHFFEGPKSQKPCKNQCFFDTFWCGARNPPRPIGAGSGLVSPPGPPPFLWLRPPKSNVQRGARFPSSADPCPAGAQGCGTDSVPPPGPP